MRRARRQSPEQTPDAAAADDAAAAPRIDREAWRRPLETLETRIRPDLRRAVVYGVTAFVALAVGHELRAGHPELDVEKLVAYACALLVLVFGVAATRSAAAELSRIASQRAGSTSTPLRLMVLVVGYLMTVLAFLTVLEVDISQFLVGGAVTGVVIGIAAQQSLGNFFAGIVLQLARPYNVGDYVRIFSGAIGGPHEGRVTEMSLVYTQIVGPEGTLNIPNSMLLAAAVSPGAEPAPAVPPALDRLGNQPGETG